MAELCALAGVSKRTLTNFSGGKQQCFVANYDIVVRRAETHILAARRSGLDGSGAPAHWSGCAPWWRRSRTRWPHTPTPRGSCCRGLGGFGALREGPPRDRNRFLRSNKPGASVIGENLHAACDVPEAGTNPSRRPRRKTRVRVALTMSTPVGTVLVIKSKGDW